MHTFTSSKPSMTTDAAILLLQSDERSRALVRDAYLDEDLAEAASRYSASPEFAEVLRWCGGSVAGTTVLDIGAGRGIATWAFLQHGAALVHALEPDGSEVVGRAAMERLPLGSAQVHAGVAESIPLPDGSVDIVFGRQVMHHMQDLNAAVAEMVRVLRPGGSLIMVREHVADNPRQLRRFLQGHPVHRLAGGEHAFRLDQYLHAFDAAGCARLAIIGPWESVVNSAPIVNSTEDLGRIGAAALANRFGSRGEWLARLPLAARLVSAWLQRDRPGRLYSFVWKRPVTG